MTDVACAILENEKGEVLATRRSATMPHPLKWEFPGGKVEPSETPESCLLREIQEELSLQIEITASLPHSIHDYGSKTIRLIPFVCRKVNGNIFLKEHLAYRWLNILQLQDLDWVEADVPVLTNYLKLKGFQSSNNFLP